MVDPAFTELEAELNQHPDLQARTEFRQGQRHVTFWQPTGDEEIPYRFIGGALYDRRDQFIGRIYEPF